MITAFSLCLFNSLFIFITLAFINALTLPPNWTANQSLLSHWWHRLRFSIGQKLPKRDRLTPHLKNITDQWTAWRWPEPNIWLGVSGIFPVPPYTTALFLSKVLKKTLDLRETCLLLHEALHFLFPWINKAWLLAHIVVMSFPSGILHRFCRPAL